MVHFVVNYVCVCRMGRKRTAPSSELQPVPVVHVDVHGEQGRQTDELLLRPLLPRIREDRHVPPLAQLSPQIQPISGRRVRHACHAASRFELLMPTAVQLADTIKHDMTGYQ